ncbi:MAG: type IX secretion system membrane protein PorP/SprF, partial [Bacteroidales bacterium]|nr:type IX secretion system membrane protein PorP/SprF [Bacteroidales bacterium]
FFPILVSNGQETPYYPVSYRVFNPFLLNPAIAGSKDYLSVDILAGSQGKSASQILSSNTRLWKKTQSFVTSPGVTEFTRIGLGGALFNDVNGFSRNIGLSGTGSYHQPLSNKMVSFLAFGASVKAVYNRYSGDPEAGTPEKSTFFPNIDAGIYYYDASLFAGISAVNILGNPEGNDSLSVVPVSREYFFIGGYKILLSKPLGIVLEPSVILNVDDSLSFEIRELLQPCLRLYAGNFSVGTFFHSFDEISFLFQYRYARFYIGAYFALPKNSPFYKKPLTTEFTFGLNFLTNKSGIDWYGHW